MAVPAVPSAPEPGSVGKETVWLLYCQNRVEPIGRDFDPPGKMMGGLAVGGDRASRSWTERSDGGCLCWVLWVWLGGSSLVARGKTNEKCWFYESWSLMVL